VKLQELQRDADANRNIYEQFLSRYKTTNEQRLLQTSQAKIASPATPPVRSNRPPLVLLLAALALASLLISGALVALLKTEKLLPLRKEPKAPKISPAVAAPAKPRLDIPVWATIPRLLPRQVRESVWQKPIVSIGKLDVSAYLAPLLHEIGCEPGNRGKVIIVTGLEAGAGASTVAQSLNLAALNSKLISALIEIRPDITASPQAATETTARTAPRYQASRASLRSVNQLLRNSQNNPAPAGDDIRSDFDLIVIDAPPFRPQPEMAGLLEHADLVVMVTGNPSADRLAIESAHDLLSGSESAALGIVINQGTLPIAARTEGAISG